MSTFWGWAAAVVVSCAPARSDDSFQNKLASACATEAGCRTLAQETETRAQRCRVQSECDQARSDLELANTRLRALVREREAGEARAKAERSARSKEEHDKHDREVAEHAEKREQQRSERERSKREAKEREAAHLRFLGPEGRKKELVACYERRIPIECTPTVADLLAAASDDRERRALITLNEKTMQRAFDKAPGPAVGQILCCDGAASTTCACGGKLKNCCPRRGGVCGCTAASPPNAQASGQ
jgi:hypothetical protein